MAQLFICEYVSLIAIICLLGLRCQVMPLLHHVCDLSNPICTCLPFSGSRPQWCVTATGETTLCLRFLGVWMCSYDSSQIAWLACVLCRYTNCQFSTRTRAHTSLSFSVSTCTFVSLSHTHRYTLVSLCLPSAVNFVHSCSLLFLKATHRFPGSL